MKRESSQYLNSLKGNKYCKNIEAILLDNQYNLDCIKQMKRKICYDYIRQNAISGYSYMLYSYVSQDKKHPVIVWFASSLKQRIPNPQSTESN